MFKVGMQGLAFYINIYILDITMGKLSIYWVTEDKSAPIIVNTATL